MGRAVNAESMAAASSDTRSYLAGILHETGWVFCWVSRGLCRVYEVIGRRLSAGSVCGVVSASCSLNVTDESPSPAETAFMTTSARVIYPV